MKRIRRVYFLYYNILWFFNKISIKSFKILIISSEKVKKTKKTNVILDCFVCQNSHNSFGLMLLYELNIFSIIFFFLISIYYEDSLKKRNYIKMINHSL